MKHQDKARRAGNGHSHASAPCIRPVGGSLNVPILISHDTSSLSGKHRIDYMNRVSSLRLVSGNSEEVATFGLRAAK
jgi:hypothetical protein